jgi:hypothetical protein
MNTLGFNETLTTSAESVCMTIAEYYGIEIAVFEAVAIATDRVSKNG